MRYLANSLYNLDRNYDVMNKTNRAEYDVIISILLKATKECSVLKVKVEIKRDAVGATIYLLKKMAVRVLGVFCIISFSVFD